MSSFLILYTFRAIEILIYYVIAISCKIALYNFIILILVNMKKTCQLIISLKMITDSRNMRKDTLQNNINCIVLLLCNQLE